MAAEEYGGGGGGPSGNVVRSSSIPEDEINMMESELLNELKSIEANLVQNPETGARDASTTSYLGQYTNRLFGSPFQLLDSVDRRFSSVNTYVGNGYLRNFLLNSPILTIKPGLPKYTGNADPTEAETMLKNAYINSTDPNEDHGFLTSLLAEAASAVIFGTGAKLQRRMFGFRENYYDYMQYVNYMCRSVATFLNLTEGSADDPNPIPTYTFMSGSNEPVQFNTAKWENYRFLGNSTVLNPFEYLMELMTVPVDTIMKILVTAGVVVGDVAVTALVTAASMIGQVETAVGLGPEGMTTQDWVDTGNDMIYSFFDITSDAVRDSWQKAAENTLAGHLVDKVCCVQFMVEPTSFTETLTNITENSQMESKVDDIMNSVGAEVAWITNSRADIGIINSLLGKLGDTTANALLKINELVKPISGGYVSDLFDGAIRSIKGQKMIYPQIYKSSNSTMNYEFDIMLTSPYGDIYNYYMNIVVPLLHLIALAAPRMVTSNTLTSPYLVQAFIPGMCTCGLGIIENMSIEKNPGGKHVSVHGFPLSVKVHFTVKELYNAMSISPANNIASFLYNETLNDYMANLAGMIPSVDMYREQRQNAFANIENYFKSGEMINDIISPFVETVENMINPWY